MKDSFSMIVSRSDSDMKLASPPLSAINFVSANPRAKDSLNMDVLCKDGNDNYFFDAIFLLLLYFKSGVLCFLVVLKQGVSCRPI